MAKTKQAPKEEGTPVSLSLEIAETGSLDQGITLNGIQNVFTEVDNVMEYALSNKDSEHALSWLDKVFATQQVAGLAAARAMHTLSERWAEFELTDTFEDVVLKRFGKARDTVDRYLLVGRMFTRIDGLDDDTKALYYGRPMKDLIAVAQFESAHGELNTRALKRLAGTTNNAELRDTLAEYRDGESEDGESKSKRLVTKLGRDGSLKARQGGKFETFGKIDLSKLENPVVAAAIERIIRGGGIERE